MTALFQVRPGNAFEVVAGSALTGGDVFLSGGVFGVVKSDTASGSVAVIDVGGIYDVVKVAGVAWAQGDKVSFNGSAFLKSDSTDDVHAVVELAATAGATSGRVRFLETPHPNPIRQPKLISLTLDEGDVAAGAGAQSFDILTATADIIVLEAWLTLDEVWAGGSLSACTAAIGEDVGADPDAYVEETDVFTGVSTGPLVSAKGAKLVEATHQPILASGQKLQLTLTPTGDTLANATTGNVTAHVLYRELP